MTGLLSLSFWSIEGKKRFNHQAHKAHKAHEALTLQRLQRRADDKDDASNQYFTIFIVYNQIGMDFLLPGKAGFQQMLQPGMGEGKRDQARVRRVNRPRPPTIGMRPFPPRCEMNAAKRQSTRVYSRLLRDRNLLVIRSNNSCWDFFHKTLPRRRQQQVGARSVAGCANWKPNQPSG